VGIARERALKSLSLLDELPSHCVGVEDAEILHRTEEITT